MPLHSHVEAEWEAMKHETFSHGALTTEKLDTEAPIFIFTRGLRKYSLFVSTGVQWTSSGTDEKENDKIVIGQENFQLLEIITTLLQKGIQIL